MLCDVARYQIVTNDTVSASADVEQALGYAQDLLEDELGRAGLLEYGEHTETLRVARDGNLYPTCWPVDADATTAHRVIGDVIYAPTPDSSPGFPGEWPRCEPLVATVTYTGGLDGSAVRGSKFYVPACVAEDLAWAAFQHLQVSPETRFPAGAIAVSSGDQSITFAEEVGPRPEIEWSCETLAYRRR